MNNRITKRAVDALKPGKRDVLIWDGEVRGFGVRCRPGGATYYLLKYRMGGRQRWYTIGKHGSPWTAETARREAKRLLGEVARHHDPAAVRDAGKAAKTVAELGKRFLNEHVPQRCKPSTAGEYARCVGLFINKSNLAGLKVEDVTPDDVAAFHHGLRRIPYQANRALGVLSNMMNLAEVWRMRPNGSNPCRHITKYPEHKRERYLSEAELARLGVVLTEVDQDGTVIPSAVAAIRLLIFTGARLSEILTLRWDYVEHSYLRLPDSKTGAKLIFLNPPARELLARLPRIEDNPYVIPGNKPGACLVNLQKPWRLIRARAGLEAVRIHDLRHTFASMGAASGLSLPMIGKLLGHTQAATTERYAHLADDPVRAASETIGQRIDAAMKGEATGADVV